MASIKERNEQLEKRVASLEDDVQIYQHVVDRIVQPGQQKLTTQFLEF